MERTLHRDPAPVRPEELLEHAAWLRRLAGSLVRGDADAEDLVQDTFLAALRRPPLDDRPVRGWLTEVVRNAGRMQARSAVRRARREAAATDGDASAPSADVLLSRLSAQRRLSELVTELPEPVRSTVLLRYFEGLPAVEIARRQAVPAGTVRWRLKIGLDRLRAELDREAGDRRRWCVLLMPLGDREGGIGMLAKQIAKGVWAMGKAAKLLAAAVVAVAGLFGWLRFGAGHHGDDGDAADKAATAQNARALKNQKNGKRGSVTLPGPALVRVPDAQVERDAAAVHGAFEGRVINWSTGQGVASAEVTFSIDGTTSVATTDEDGHFDLTPPRAGKSVLVMASAQGYLPFAPEWGKSPFELYARAGLRVRDITVQLVPALDYTGVVVDPAGKPVPGAAVTLLGQGERALHPIEDHFTADEKGEFQFHAPDDALLEARHPAFGTGRARMMGAPLVSRRLTIPLPAKDGAPLLGSERIAGRVVDPQGGPVAGAMVKAHPHEMKGEWKGAAGQATTDAAGRFTIEGLDPGAHSLLATREGFATAIADKVASGATDVVLDLRRGFTLVGRVLESEGGAPLAAFNVLVARRDGPLQETSIAVRSVVDAEGRFTVPDIAPGDYRVRATAYGHAPSKPADVTVTEAPAGAGPLEIRLGRGGKLAGRLVDTTDGTPLKGARVSVDGHQEGSTAAPAVINALTNDQGEFELTGVPVGVRSVILAAYQHNMRLVSGIRFDEGITTGPLTFDLGRTRDGEEPHTEMVGVGVTLHPEGDGLRIDKLIPGGGAMEVGVAVGDTILAVDGAQAATLGMDETIQHIRGPEGSTVRLTVRKADGTVTDLVVPRRRLQT